MPSLLPPLLRRSGCLLSLLTGCLHVRVVLLGFSLGALDRCCGRWLHPIVMQLPRRFQCCLMLLCSSLRIAVLLQQRGRAAVVHAAGAGMTVLFGKVWLSLQSVSARSAGTMDYQLYAWVIH